MKISDVLIKAKTLIQDPENWTQGVLARDNLYEPVPATSRNAVCFCTYGAVDRALGLENSIQYHEVTRLLRKVCAAISGSSMVAVYNDTHTHPEVLALFDKAIELAKESETCL